ncbi:uncharacterized protein HKW66_Vig0244340 [Vigna angularis]|uniref:HMA domain-containing protein n=1 Tax=Phaseolus angularis TaxID=3914 RepID=A0A8T0KXU0_PHAAN|nr:uncharacterized protein HKW66_Vig0244340 [Vigna angularis]
MPVKHAGVETVKADLSPNKVIVTGTMDAEKLRENQEEGVQSVNLDGSKDLVTVKGRMDVKEMVSYLNEKLKRNIKVVPPEKEEEKKEKVDGVEKKEKDGGSEKKEKHVATEAKVERLIKWSSCALSHLRRSGSWNSVSDYDNSTAKFNLKLGKSKPHVVELKFSSVVEDDQ